MAYITAKPCIGTKDTACVDVCPVDCIHPAKGRTYEDGRPTVQNLYADSSRHGLFVNLRHSPLTETNISCSISPSLLCELRAARRVEGTNFRLRGSRPCLHFFARKSNLPTQGR